MIIARVVEHRYWRHTSGATASLRGAVPYTSEAGRAEWTVVRAGWVWQYENGTVGNGRAPFATEEEARAGMVAENARLERCRAAAGAAAPRVYARPWHAPSATDRGARMERPSDPPADFVGRRTRLERVRLDAGGYDKGGAYWGLGNPLFCAWTSADDGDVRTGYRRATDREAAKALFPGALFYR